MLFNRPVTEMLTTAINAENAQPAASNGVLGRLRVGRHTITITAKANGVSIGGPDLTATNGRPVANGESVTIPVDSDEVAPVYVIGSVALTEYF